MMRHLFFVTSLVVAAAAGCAGSSDEENPEAGSSSFDSTGGSPGTGTATGSFCEVQALLVSRCQDCHSSPPQSGAPMALVTYDDLVAPAVSNPSVRVVDASLARMQSPAAPMPPPPFAPPTSEEVAVLQAWVNAGLPATCPPQATGGASGTASSTDVGG